jgi:hypothetical protein
VASVSDPDLLARLAAGYGHNNPLCYSQPKSTGEKLARNAAAPKNAAVSTTTNGPTYWQCVDLMTVAAQRLDDGLNLDAERASRPRGWIDKYWATRQDLSLNPFGMPGRSLVRRGSINRN